MKQIGKLIERGYDCDRLARGDKLLIGNGVYGFRGTIDENRAADCVALNAACFYDKNGDNWRETVNMPNPLWATLSANERTLDGNYVTEHTETLDLSCGVYTRVTKYNVDGTNVTFVSERFFDQTDYNLLACKRTVTADKPTEITLTCGIDCDVWNISGKHFDVTESSHSPLSVKCTTNEGKHLSVILRNVCEIPSQNGACDGIIYDRFTTRGTTLEVTSFAVLSHDGAEKEVPTTAPYYDKLRRANDEWWTAKWDVSRVEIEDTLGSQLAVDYSVYQLIVYAPRIDGMSIGARGLSGQTYKGAIFWDTEMFMLPFYMTTDTRAARRLVEYRINTLDGALAKAKYYGYDGAFFAWESQEGGFDACSDFNVTDVFTGRPVRTYFKDKQVHISADIAVALYNYFAKTDDIDIFAEDGLRLLLECAKFYNSYAYYNHNKDRFELLDVIGPDEYHERVNNNVYTNYMAYETVDVFFRALAVVKHRLPDLYAQVAADKRTLVALRKFRRKLYLPQPNKDGVIEQFDGYFRLEDVDVATVRERLVKPNEYWGGSGGVATATRVIKQADVIAAMVVLPHRFDKKVVKANYEFYLPYTEHGSSLSASMYAQCASLVGCADESYEWFIRTANVDMVGGGKKYAGKVYIGGTHPAACGGAWLTLQNGYAAKSDGSRLPEQVSEVVVHTEHGTKSVCRS